MTKIILFILIGFAAVQSYAQNPVDETTAVKKVISQLFDGMRKGDSSLVHQTFGPGMILQTIIIRDGKVQVRNEEPAAFLKAIGTPHKDVWDEQISFDYVLLDLNLASVWTSYKFFAGGKFSHCGVNSFQLVKGAQGWKIVYLIDTRRKQNCN